MFKGSPARACEYLSRGAGLLATPGLKRFTIVPLLANMLVFIMTTAVLVHFFSDLLHSIMAWLPSWLAFLAWLLWLVFAFALLFVYGFSFNVITNIIAAPFYGLLAEKIEWQLTGIRPPQESWGALVSRTLGRELTKLWYFLTRGSLVFIIIMISWFIPGINLITLAISSLWAAWCMVVQYADYPADNHQTSFRALRQKLSSEPLTSYSLGGMVMLGSSIPFINIFVMPIAVAGATVYWVDTLNISDKPRITS